MNISSLNNAGIGEIKALKLMAGIDLKNAEGEDGLEGPLKGRRRAVKPACVALGMGDLGQLKATGGGGVVVPAQDE